MKKIFDKVKKIKRRDTLNPHQLLHCVDKIFLLNPHQIKKIQIKVVKLYFFFKLFFINKKDKTRFLNPTESPKLF